MERRKKTVNFRLRHHFHNCTSAQCTCSLFNTGVPTEFLILSRPQFWAAPATNTPSNQLNSINLLLVLLRQMTIILLLIEEGYKRFLSFLPRVGSGFEAGATKMTRVLNSRSEKGQFTQGLGPCLYFR